MIKSLRYSVLLHGALILPLSLLHLLLLMPVYNGGLRTVPILVIFNLAFSCLLCYWNYKRAGDVVVFFMNMNREPTMLSIIFVTLNLAVFLLLLVILLRYRQELQLILG